MLLRLSRFVHLIPVAEDRVLVIDAISHVRLVVDRSVARVIQNFATPTPILTPSVPPLIGALVDRGILTIRTPEEELAGVASQLSPFHGRDPAELLERFRREVKEGGLPYYAVSKAATPEDFTEPKGRRIDLLLFGLCDVHIETDFLRREAAGRDIDLRVAATFPDDLRLAGEHKHDIVLIGALNTRHGIIDDPRGGAPHAGFIAEARQILTGLRQHTQAPILIDGLPEPTVQPLGFAEHGPQGHRNRFRLANLALAELAAEFSDVYPVDVAAILAAAGSERMLDDGQFGYTHFGSPGWLLQRDESEKGFVHGIFPDLAPLAEAIGGDPYGREVVMARAHVDALAVVLGLDRKKCVIVDLDGLLWPGVLAETGSPFALPSGETPYSYTGLYFGLHEALLSLKKRGILLACVSKNDEATVRELWKYEDHYPLDLLLTQGDFVTWRVNWNDKVDNIRAIADELGLALESFIFIDDNPVERERVRQRLPEVEVWGEEPFGLRRRLLNDPRLQTPRLTGEAAARTELTRAQIGRQSARAESVSESDFIASLNVQTRIERLTPGAELGRVAELFQRTTQFNTTGLKRTPAELEALLKAGGRIYVAYVKDRFGDHGLVGAAIVQNDEMLGFALSCRVLGLGVEHRLLQQAMDDHPHLKGRIIATARNAPVRNLYRDNGFVLNDAGFWERSG